jgi:hypothetical protein
MTITVTLYNQTVNAFNTGIHADSDTYKVLFLNADAVFDATDVTLEDVAGVESEGVRDHEVSGSGWSDGGEELTGVVVDVHDTNGGKFDADNLSVTVSAELGPISAFVLVNSSDDSVVLFGTHSSPVTIASGKKAGVLWPENGIILWEVD